MEHPTQPFQTRHTRSFGIVGLAGVAVFATVCLAVQFLRTDLDWIAAPLSYYLVGPYGDAVQAVYVALAVTLVALGIGFYRELSPSARSAAPLLLFVVSAVSLVVTALSEAAKTRGQAAMWEWVHLVAAQTTFLCVTVAMQLQSWRLRHDERWRRHFGFAFVLASVAFVALLVYALGHLSPRGLQQKGVITLIVAWLAWGSLNLWRGAPPGSSEVRTDA
ncbi:DUF998 domain-containing protein [Dokdonella soli]|uniref:DUF998 domain-containing protein n=1 Tax=Dokdonella soli TaxID=529810 RepID=A0ABN1IDC0_9GAMM